MVRFFFFEKKLVGQVYGVRTLDRDKQYLKQKQESYCINFFFLLKIYCIDGKKTKLKIKGSWTIKKSQELFREDYWHLQPHLIHFLPCSGSRSLPSLPCEGDRDQKWLDLGSVARFRFRFLSFSLLIFLFCLLLATRSDVSEPPPPPLSSPTFCFTSFSSNRVLYRWDLLEALDGSSLQQTLSLLSARLFLSNGRRDLLRPWMFGGHRVWGLLPVWDSIDYPLG